jgi:hypothetical protein
VNHGFADELRPTVRATEASEAFPGGTTLS